MAERGLQQTVRERRDVLPAHHHKHSNDTLPHTTRFRLILSCLPDPYNTALFFLPTRAPPSLWKTPCRVSEFGALCRKVTFVTAPEFDHSASECAPQSARFHPQSPQIDREATGHAGGLPEAVRAEQAPPTKCIHQRGEFRLSLHANPPDSECCRSYAFLLLFNSLLTRGERTFPSRVDSTLAVSPKVRIRRSSSPLVPPSPVEPASWRY